MEKNGMFNDKSKGDFDMSKKAEFIDESSDYVADAANKDRLIKPLIISVPHGSGGCNRGGDAFKHKSICAKDLSKVDFI